MHRAGLIALALACSAGLPRSTLPAAAQHRPDVAGTEAAVVADHPLAVAAGSEVLRRGGNAIDAAITMAAVLAVVLPHSNGIGGDAVMLYREAASGRVHALNGSGRAAELATPEAFRSRGYDAVPELGVLSVTVPGALRLWADALRRFGTIPLAGALAPAIQLAESGFPVSARFSADIERERARLEEDAELRAAFLPNGSPPQVGSLLRQPNLGASLRLIAEDGPDVFYVGELARRIDAFMASHEGLLRIEDLAAHSTLWQQPVAVGYRGYRVHVLPPNTQGIALLMQMNLAELFDLESYGRNTPEYIHALVEIQRLAFRDRDRHVADPAFVDVPLEQLLSKEYARRLAAELGARTAGDAAAAARHARDDGGDTAVLAVVDGAGNAVAIVQSLYHPFGSSRMVPGTGIVLHNRAAAFSLDAAHANVIAPRKRPYHTLSPALALRPDGSLFLVFATPGGDAQTATLLQVFHNVTMFGMTPQQAVEAPRFRALDNGVLLVEDALPGSMWQALAAFGHSLRRQPPLSAELGGAQLILVHGSGVRMVGADPRREAYGLAW